MTNVTHVMELDIDRWRDLVDTVMGTTGELTDNERKNITTILRLDSRNAAITDNIVDAAVRNSRQVINALHDPMSTLLTDVLDALREGKLVVLDLSRFRARAQALLGVLLGHIFERNMERFTHGDGAMIPVIAVVEEAQNVLNGKETEVTRPFIEFTKEGRKFGCGIFGITQQPGAIDDEIMSQGDNFFAFHLLSDGDLKALSKANPHFSDDLLSGLLNEPLVGSGLFFSLYSSKQYPIPFRPFDFAKRNTSRLNPSADLSDIYAAELRHRALQRRVEAEPEQHRAVEQVAAELPTDAGFMRRCRNGETRPGRVQMAIAQYAPDHIRQRDEPGAVGSDQWRQPSALWAKPLVERALDLIFPAESGGWEYLGTDPFRQRIRAPKGTANPGKAYSRDEPPPPTEPPERFDDEPPF